MTAHNNICTAMRPASDHVYTWTAKSAPWLPWHRDHFLAKVPGCNPDACRKPTLTFFIAGPLAVMPDILHNRQSQ